MADAYAFTPNKGDIHIEFKFGRGLREAYAESKNYTMLDLPFVMQFKKRYSIRLYMLICSFINLKQTHREFDFDELRHHLGIHQKSRYSNCSLLHDCIESALKEINEIPYIDVHINVPKHGQKFLYVDFIWETKYKRRFIKQDHLGLPLGNDVLE